MEAALRHAGRSLLQLRSTWPETDSLRHRHAARLVRELGLALPRGPGQPLGPDAASALARAEAFLADHAPAAWPRPTVAIARPLQRVPERSA